MSLSVQPDHVQIFVGTDSFNLPCDIVKSFKVISALKLFKRLPSQRIYL
ncbi:MAG: hypothetical protein ACXAEU_15160 [Candidatus Hodarchaeales archaeon]